MLLFPLEAEYRQRQEDNEVDTRTKPAYKLKGPKRTSDHAFFSPGDLVVVPDVCAIIGSQASTQTLGRLASVSKGAKYTFEKSLNFRHDAHVILQVMMNHPEEMHQVLQQAEKLYRSNVWKLLLEPVPGTEEHCGRHWNSISAICFAAWSGNVYQYLYEIVAMPENEDAVLEQGKLYVAFQSLRGQDSLSYAVVDPDGNRIKNFIPAEDLGCNLRYCVDQQTGELNCAQLQSIALASILAITYKRGHTNDVNPEHPEIANTYLLNRFYQYIPQEYRYLANDQLEKFGVSRRMLPPVDKLLQSYNCFEGKYGDLIGSFDVDSVTYSEINDEWIRLSDKFKSLSWHSLSVICNETNWVSLMFENNFPAPESEPMLHVDNEKIPLRDCLRQLGNSYGIYLGDNGGAFTAKSCMYGPASGSSQGNFNDICFYGQVITAQFRAFLAWQKLLDERFREEKKSGQDASELSLEQQSP
ncbi:MAG: hypothetical protein ACD_46C00153G0001, partial [uncultured bacterium]